jgi:small-conductance mechanosensitive channel
MMHHDYPLPPPETLAWIEEGRRKGVAEQTIVQELQRRGMSAAAIAAALAPGATVCALAESSVEKISFYTFARMTLYGCVIGFLAAWFMVRRNSQALRGQDRMGRSLGWMLPAYLLLMVVMGFVVRALLPVAHLSFGFWTVISMKMVAIHVIGTLLFVSRARRAQQPFADDAMQRDEYAPADLMIPFLFGVFAIATEVALVATGSLLASF